MEFTQANQVLQAAITAIQESADKDAQIQSLTLENQTLQALSGNDGSSFADYINSLTTLATLLNLSPVPSLTSDNSSSS